MNTLSPEDWVTVKDVSFSYDDHQVLRDISLRVPKGRVVAIMGASGSGKTTLLHLIGGLLQAQKGSVIVDGHDLSKVSHRQLYSIRQGMGMLFQFGALFTDLSVFDNVAFPMREQTDLSEAAIRDIVLLKLQAVGLRGAANLMPSELSGGMARRVALARAVALDPKLVLYDEPFAGLDPISLGVIARLIRLMSDASGSSAVMVTHDVYSSLNMVDYVYFIYEGRIHAEGTPEEIRQSTDPYVVQFINGQPEGPVQFNYPAPPYFPALLKEEGDA